MRTDSHHPERNRAAAGRAAGFAAVMVNCPTDYILVSCGIHTLVPLFCPRSSVSAPYTDDKSIDARRISMVSRSVELIQIVASLRMMISRAST